MSIERRSSWFIGLCCAALTWGGAAYAQAPTAPQAEINMTLDQARNIGVAALEQGNPTLALQIGYGLLQADPNDAFAHYLIASAFRQQARPAAARRAAALAYRQAETTPEKFQAAQLAARMPSPARAWARQLGVGVVAGARVLVADSYAAMVWWQALTAGLAAWAGLTMMTEPAALSMVEQHALLSLADMRDGFRKLGNAVETLSALSLEGLDAAREQVSEIIADLIAIGEDYRTDPGDVMRSQTFLNHHLPMVVDLAASIDRLNARGGLDERQQQELAQAVARLEGLAEACHRQRMAWARNDVMALSITGEVLERLLKPAEPVGVR